MGLVLACGRDQAHALSGESWLLSRPGRGWAAKKCPFDFKECLKRMVIARYVCMRPDSSIY